ncbi:MAG: methyltransferase domain-containing protein [bacterium]
MKRSLVGIVFAAILLLGYLSLTKIGFLKNPQKELEESRPPDVLFIVTPQNVVEKMLEIAEVGKDDLVYDLGCGDGRIVITAAKKYGCKAIGYDIDPKCVKEALENVEKNNVGHLVQIEQKDIFTLDLSEATVITLFLLPDLNLKLIPQLEKLRPGSRIVSHAFDIEGVEPDKIVDVTSEDGSSIIYFWTTPLKKAESTDPEINRLCRSVDSAVASFQFEVKCRDTFSKETFQHRLDIRNKRLIAAGHEELVDERTAAGLGVFERVISIVAANGKVQIEDKSIAPAFGGEPGQSAGRPQTDKNMDVYPYEEEDSQQHMLDISSDNLPSPFLFITHLSFGRGLSYYSGLHMELISKEDTQNLESLLVYESRAEERPIATFLLDKNRDFCWTHANIFDNEGNITVSVEASDFRKVDDVWIPFQTTFERFQAGELIYHRDAEIISARIIHDEGAGPAY